MSRTSGTSGRRRRNDLRAKNSQRCGAALGEVVGNPADLAIDLLLNERAHERDIIKRQRGACQCVDAKALRVAQVRDDHHVMRR